MQRLSYRDTGADRERRNLAIILPLGQRKKAVESVRGGRWAEPPFRSIIRWLYIHTNVSCVTRRIYGKRKSPRFVSVTAARKYLRVVMLKCRKKRRRLP